MKKTFVLFVIVALLVSNCKKEKEEPEEAPVKSGSFLDTVSPTRYHANDPFAGNLSPVNNKWKVFSASASGTYRVPGFDHLIIKQNGIFAITRNDSLLEYGGITVANNNEVGFKTDNGHLSRFVTGSFRISTSRDTLRLITMNPDGYIFHFKKD